MKKRITILVIIFTFISLLLGIRALATSSCNLEITSNSNFPKRGDELDFVISVEDIVNPIIGTRFTVNYDNTVLELTDQSEALNDWKMIQAENSFSMWAHNYEEVTTEQQICRISFKVKEEAELGETIIKLKSVEITKDDASTEDLGDTELLLEIKPREVNVNVGYSTEEITNESVIVTLSSDEELQEIDGWELSTDKKQLTKQYVENKEETIIVKDLIGNEKSVIISITNIDKEKPVIIAENITYGETLNIGLQDTLSGVIEWQINQSETEPVNGWTQITSATDTTVQKTGLDAGTYYIWARDEAGNVVSKNIIVMAKQITAPIANTGLVYTGLEQIGIESGEDYRVEEGKKIEAGNYNATAILEDKENTVWKDTNDTEDKTFKWSISKKQVQVEWKEKDLFTYDGNNHAPELIKEQVDGVNNERINLEVTGVKKNVGTNYTATAVISSVTGGQENKENYELTGDTKIFEITAKNISQEGSNVTGSLDKTVYTYDGTEKTPTEEIKDGTKTLKKGTDYTVDYENNTNAGTGKVNITGKGNYTGIIILEFTINKKKIAIPTLEDKTYNAKEQKIEAGEGYTFEGTTKATNVSTYNTEAKLNDTANTEWSDTTSEDKIMTWKILAYNLSNASIKTIGTQEYTESEITPEPEVTVPIPDDKTTTLEKETDYTVEYEENINVGTGKVTVTGKGNYIGTKVVNFTIAQKVVKVNSSDYNGIYDGDEHSITIEPTEPTSGTTIYYKEGTEELTAENYETGSIEKLMKKNAGEYTIQWYVHTTNEKFSDKNGSNKIIIAKKQSETKVSIEGTNTYGSILSANVTTNGDGKLSYQWYKDSISEENKISGATNKEYTIEKGLVGKKLYVVVTFEDGENYIGSTANDVTDSSNNETEEVKVKEITKPTINKDLIYTGTEQELIEETEDYNVEDGIKTNAGNYTATIELKDRENTVWEDTNDTEDKVIEWSISKKEIEIEWDDMAIFEYNDENQGLTLKNTQVDGVNNEKINLEVTGQQKDAGANYIAIVKIISVLGGQENIENYKLKGNTRTFEIKPTFVIVNSSDYNGVYDGNEHGITVEVSEPKSDYEIYYKEGSEKLTADNYLEESQTNLTKKDVGTYTIQWYIHTTNSNYSDISGSNTIIITDTPKNNMLGDTNQNKEIDTGDILLLLRHIAQANSKKVLKKHPNWVLSEEKKLIGDVNKNGTIDVGDILKLRRYISAKNSKKVAKEHSAWLYLE